MPATAAMTILDHILLDPVAHLDSVINGTTASSTTRRDEIIEVSLRPARPPLPSDLLVHCPGLDPSAFTVLPHIVRAEGPLLLLRVAIGCDPDYLSPADCDYFVYRADAERGPSLQRVSCPHPFHDDDVGLLPRGDHYTIAALSPSLSPSPPDAYDLLLFHSETPEAWSRHQVTLEEPERDPPLKIPHKCHRLFYHDTGTVVAIGGEGGTVGWVDLWRSILLCDVLRDPPTLRAMPLPLPMDLIRGNNGHGFELGCPDGLRGIAFINDKTGRRCLKLVHLEAKATVLPDDDEETGLPNFLMHDWAVTTWTNSKMSSSWEDWGDGHTVQASDTTVDGQLSSELLDSGLLLNKSQALHNLLVSDPAPAIDPSCEDVVYLLARVKFLHPKAWALALDTRKNTLLSAAEFGTERQPDSRVVYCPSSISKYMMNPETATPDGNLRIDAEECSA